MATDTLILGAGPAGLAVAACLARSGVPYEVLDAAGAVGSRWRGHYDRLHLHTTRQHSNLPYHPMPSSWPRYPSRDQLVAYLEGYARHFRIRPRFHQHVRRITRQGGRWVAHTDHQGFQARNLVVATGYNRVPHRPALPGLETFKGPVLHSAGYRNGRPFAGRDVLVVGCGNSGAEIALDLCEQGARPSMVVRGPTHVIPRDLLGRPSQHTSLLLSRLPLPIADRIARASTRLAVGDLSPWGIQRPRKGPIRLIVEDGRVSLLDIGTIGQIKAGRIQVVPAVQEVRPDGVTFCDGRTLPFQAIVLATGYRSGLSELMAGPRPLDHRDLPRRHGAPTLPGLYFVGFRNPPTGALREIAIEAKRVAAHVAFQR